jgi:hypothetical protein
MSLCGCAIRWKFFLFCNLQFSSYEAKWVLAMVPRSFADEDLSVRTEALPKLDDEEICPDQQSGERRTQLGGTNCFAAFG